MEKILRDEMPLIVMYNTLKDQDRFEDIVYIVIAPDVMLFPVSPEFKTKNDCGLYMMCGWGPEQDEMIEPAFIQNSLETQSTIKNDDSYYGIFLGYTYMLRCNKKVLLDSLESIGIYRGWQKSDNGEFIPTGHTEDSYIAQRKK